MEHRTVFGIAVGLTLIVAGCSGTSSDPDALRTALTQFETSSAKTADSLLALYDAGGGGDRHRVAVKRAPGGI